MFNRVVILSSALLSSCVPDMEHGDREFLKRIEFPGGSVEWFYWPMRSGSITDLLLFEYMGGIDTICVAENITDINVYYPDSLVVTFHGKPTAYDRPARVLSRLETGVLVHVDTMGSYVAGYSRPTFRPAGLPERPGR